MEEIQLAIDAQLWRLALFGVMTLPDIAAALGSADGNTNGARYRAWWTANVPQQRQRYLPAAEAWKLRCSMLHQASGLQQEQTDRRVVFILDGPVTTDGRADGPGSLVIADLARFTKDVLGATRSWLRAAENNANYQRNVDRLVQVRPEGFPPVLGGMTVLA